MFRQTEFPRSANYDPGWVLDNMMGPNALWLTESLTACMRLDPPMRVLDLVWSERLGKPSDEADMLAIDRGQTLGFTRVVARRNERPTVRLDSL